MILATVLAVVGDSITWLFNFIAFVLVVCAIVGLLMRKITIWYALGLIVAAVIVAAVLPIFIPGVH